MAKLAEKPDSIERIFEIRDWMETIPMSVKSLDEITRRLVLEYDMLDAFWYNLPQEDFENKWEAIGWPLQIQRQIEVTNLFLDEETDKFLKLQMNDELVLQDKIETFTVQVTQMSLLRDFTKVLCIWYEEKVTLCQIFFNL